MYEIRITPACISARLCAWLIDAAISVAIMAGMMFQLVGSVDIAGFLLQANYAEVGALLIGPLAFQLLFAGAKQCSPGLYAMDLQLLRADGELVQWSNTARRPLGMIVLLGTGFLSGLVPFFNENRRSLGDYFSGSRVVETLALGTRVSYDAWRIFKNILRPVAPISLALALVFLLASKGDQSNKTVLLDAVVIAATGTILLAIVIAGIKVKVTRVRVAPKGILRSGWFGWSNDVVPWGDMDYARVRPRRLFPYFEVHKINRRKFKVPLENNSAQYTAGALLNNGVRIEQ